MDKKRLKYIDVLRVLAMITVLTCHYTRSLEYAGVGFVNKILPDEFFGIYLGGFGVSIFFILSGASLMYTYEGKLDLKRYCKKRFLGIFPMYYMAWLFAFLYYFWKNKGFFSTVPRVKILLTVFGMDGYANWYGPNFYLLGEWFLGCLLFLYILFPLLKWGIEKHPLWTGGIILLVYFVCAFFYHGTIPVENFFLARVPEFAFGMYFVHYKWKVKLPVALAGGALLAATWFVNLSMIDTLYKNTIVGITAFVFVVYICNFIKWEGFYRIMEQIGKYAYAVFLTHHVLITELALHFNGRVFSRLENVIMYVLYLVIVALASKGLYALNQALVGKKKAIT